jgi:hypothetical protein
VGFYGEVLISCANPSTGYRSVRGVQSSHVFSEPERESTSAKLLPMSPTNTTKVEDAAGPGFEM